MILPVQSPVSCSGGRFSPSRLVAVAHRLGLFAVLGLVLSGCPQPGGGFSPFPQTGGAPLFPGFSIGAPAPAGQPLTPGAAGGTGVPTVSVLLPTSGALAGIGANMRNAAVMALDEAGGTSVQFNLADTASNPSGAQAAAASAIAGGASMIVGPLMGDSMSVVAQIANPRGLAVLGITNDVSRARPGAWTLGLAPAQSMDRLMQWAAQNNRRRVAIIAPITAYGNAALNAARASAARNGISLTLQETYGSDDQSKNLAAQRIGQRRAEFDAIIIPDSGTRLREIASLLFFYEVDPAEKQYMGLEGWDDDSLRVEQSLVGGIYAVPPTGTLSGFEQRYQQRFGELPEIQSAAVYDAMNLAIELARQSESGQALNGFSQANPFSTPALTRNQGFSGVLGGYRLDASGRVQRLYEIKRITPNGNVVVERARQNFGSSQVTSIGLPAG